MNKEQAAGKVDEVKGKVKEKVGHAIKKSETEVEGINDQVKGKVEQAHGDAKERADKAHKA